jgi:hypothetical protein
VTTINRTIGTIIGVAMVVAFTALIVALVLSLASDQFPGIKTIGSEVRCLLGVPEAGSECVARQMADLSELRRALEDERKRLVDVDAAQEFVFTQGDRVKDRVTLVVGTLYRDAAAQTGLIRSFCWIIVDNEGLDPRVEVAVLNGDGRTEERQASLADLALLEMSERDVDAARAACPFPRVR